MFSPGIKVIKKYRKNKAVKPDSLYFQQLRKNLLKGEVGVIKKYMVNDKCYLWHGVPNLGMQN